MPSQAGRGRISGNGKTELADIRAACRLAGDLSHARAGGAPGQSMALFRGLRGCDHRPDPRIHAGWGCGAYRPDLCRRHGIRRKRSEQILALDAERIFRKHGLADRRRVRVLDRLSQKRPRPADRPDAGAQPRPADARPRLCRCIFRRHPCAGDAIEHRAKWRHGLSNCQQHPANLRLGARTDSRPDRHLCDVDGIRDHGRDEFAFPDGTCAECRGSRHREKNCQCRYRLVTMVHRLRAFGHSAAAAGAIAELRDL